MMTEQIGHKITELVDPIVPLSLYEAETEEYPYAYYINTPVRHRTKDGDVYKITSDVVISVVGRSFDQADDISNQIADAIESGMAGDGFRGELVSVERTCYEGVWTIDNTFAVKQMQ